MVVGVLRGMQALHRALIANIILVVEKPCVFEVEKIRSFSHFTVSS